MSTTTETKSIRLQLKKFIRAKRERVFAAWTQPELMKRWFAPAPRTVRRAESDPRVGGAYLVQMEGEACDGGDAAPVVEGRYLKIIPNELLVFTWRFRGDPPPPETQVTVQLRDVEGGTELILTHEKFVTEESRDRHQQGWNGCLDSLAGAADRGGLGAS